MRKPKVKNKYNLKFADIRKLKVGDKTKICEPLFWRNNVINAWCILGSTAKTKADKRYSTYNEFWIGIYDNGKIRANCYSFGGMCGYNFKNFFDYKDIENESDLEIQEMLLNKINYLIDEGILQIKTD